MASPPVGYDESNVTVAVTNLRLPGTSGPVTTLTDAGILDRGLREILDYEVSIALLTCEL